MSRAFQYYLIFKPYGMLSQFTKEGEWTTLSDLGYPFEKDVYPVGRLDADSEGLLLLTNDGELAQIAQAQSIPYKRKPCTELGKLNIEGVAIATGAAYLAMPDNASIADVVAKADEIARGGTPVIVDVGIDYSKCTAFTTGTVKTNFARFPFGQKMRILTRAAVRHVVG